MKCLLGLFISLCISNAIADFSIDIGRSFQCDPIYRPDGCVPATDGGTRSLDLKNHMYYQTGFIMKRDEKGQRAQDYEVTIRPRRPTQVTRRTGTANVAQAISDPDPNQATGTQEARSNANNGFGFNQEGQTQAASVQPAGVNIQNPGKGITTVGGMMYGDDEPELQKIAVEGQPSRGTLQDQMPTQAALNSNNLHDTGSGPGGDGGGNRGPAAATGGGMNPAAFGFENNSAPASTGGSGGYGNLGALAAALGNGVMGAINAVFDSGNSGPKHAGVFGRHTGAGGVGAGTNAKDQAAQIAQADRLRDLLKDRYGRYISSRKGLEFGAANTKPFQGMCGHYSAYADQHGIPTYAEIKCEGD